MVNSGNFTVRGYHLVKQLLVHLLSTLLLPGKIQKQAYMVNSGNFTVRGYHLVKQLLVHLLSTLLLPGKIQKQAYMEKSGGNYINLEINLQTVEIQMRRL